MAICAGLLAWAEPVFAQDKDQPHFPLPPFAVDAPKTPRAAPDFTLSSNTGQKVQLKALRSRVVVINFWATWCVPCVAELPELKRLADGFQGQPFTLLAIDVEDTPAKVQAFLQKHQMTLPVLYDDEGDTLRAYGGRGLPTTVIVDHNGNWVAQALGSKQWNSPEAVRYFRKLIDAVPRK
ncbi:MAG TPA: TlpA disulfide reductase family protein [bacterium]